MNTTIQSLARKKLAYAKLLEHKMSKYSKKCSMGSCIHIH